MPQLVLDDFNLAAAERRLCLAALEQGGNIVNAAKLLGITRHALKRRISKHHIAWPQPAPQVPATAPTLSPSA
jgi:DNA-binding NtrC family response regulator